VAVLGTAIDKIYPRRNYGLAKRILEKGAIISEYAPGIETKAYSFQIRNRIVSGLADAVLIVEASEHSGTRGTYEYALKQGKDVFVVPGDITRPMSVGTNLMLRDGASPYLSVDDILLSMKLNAIKRPELDLSSLSPLEKAILLEFKHGQQSTDDILEKLDIDMAAFNSAVSQLELNDYVEYRDGIWTIR
jgi:DNA processing protein